VAEDDAEATGQVAPCRVDHVAAVTRQDRLRKTRYGNEKKAWTCTPCLALDSRKEWGEIGVREGSDMNTLFTQHGFLGQNVVR
jgi:hypothetical protein